MLEIDQLKGFPFFSDIPQEKLLEIAQWGKVLEFGLNEIIFCDGENALDLYGVVDGEVELSLVVMDEIIKTHTRYEKDIQTHVEKIQKDIIFDSIEPGEIFGWSSLIKPSLFTATAKCSKSTRLISLPADKLKAIFNKNPEVGYVFMERVAEIISQRLKYRTEKMVESWTQAFDVNKI